MIVAVVYDADGGVHDLAHTYETGITYANQGYSVKATADDGPITMAMAQSGYDHELMLAIDCFVQDMNREGR